MPDNDDKLKYNRDLPYSDAEVAKDPNFGLEGIDEIDFEEQDISDIAIPSRWERFKHKAKQTWSGKNKVGRYLGLGLDLVEGALPKPVSRIRDIIQSQTQTKEDTNMNWLLNRLQERSTWRGIIISLTAVGVGLSPDQTQAIAGLGVALFAAIEVFMKEPKSKDAK